MLVEEALEEEGLDADEGRRPLGGAGGEEDVLDGLLCKVHSVENAEKEQRGCFVDDSMVGVEKGHCGPENLVKEHQPAGVHARDSDLEGGDDLEENTASVHCSARREEADETGENVRHCLSLCLCVEGAIDLERTAAPMEHWAAHSPRQCLCSPAFLQTREGGAQHADHAGHEVAQLASTADGSLFGRDRLSLPEGEASEALEVFLQLSRLSSSAAAAAATATAAVADATVAGARATGAEEMDQILEESAAVVVDEGRVGVEAEKALVEQHRKVGKEGVGEGEEGYLRQEHEGQVASGRREEVLRVRHELVEGTPLHLLPVLLLLLLRQ
mmetsp:Transcript_2619/g.9299  ORF Transcript_2619/g.9299 Transcript_2619/m.9299 type:complete len:329 (-) Transcript_2619:1184-2170(-)